METDANTESPSGAQDVIFSELRFKNLTLKNRIIRSNMTGRWDNYDGSGTQTRINWDVKFAQRGVAAIVSAHAPISRLGWISPNVATIDSDATLPFWRRLIDQIHKYDCKYIIQLSHSGRQRDIPGVVNRKAPAFSSTKTRDWLQGLPSHAMTESEIEEVIFQFGASALRAKQASADGVETHSANGYLLTQFLSPTINNRTDKYGGCLENRARFLLRVIKEIRRRVGPSYHLQVKLSAVDYSNALKPWAAAGTTIEDSINVAKWCVNEGADAIVVSGGNFAPHPKNPAGDFPINTARRTYESMINGGTKTLRNFLLLRVKPFGPIFQWWWKFRRGPRNKIGGIFLNESKRIKAAVDVPVLVTGGFQSASLIRRAIEEKKCDGVTIARPLIANPDLVEVFARGLDSPERPCTFCNQCLIEALESPLGCYELDRFGGDFESMMAEVMSVFKPSSFQ